jgi:hypothetical protein
LLTAHLAARPKIFHIQPRCLTTGAERADLHQCCAARLRTRIFNRVFHKTVENRREKILALGLSL